MITILIRSLAATGLALALVGCTNDSEPDQSTDGSTGAQETAVEIEPERVDITVTLAEERAPFDVFGNHDDRRCTTYTVADAFAGRPDSPVSVTLRNADGRIVGNEDLPLIGGEWSAAGGCLWEVEFRDIEDGDFFEVEVDTPNDGSFDATGEPDELRIEF